MVIHKISNLMSTQCKGDCKEPTEEVEMNYIFRITNNKVKMKLHTFK
jgi:hypothetical protein